MSETFAFPAPDPLHRLNVHDNLTINADRWSFAHGYHRQKQRLYYQSLYQPGIVYGLGVKVIAAPAQSRFKDPRWLEVQPGMAIDYQGNFVIVHPSHDRTYRLAVPAPQQAPTTVYLIVKYVDPDGLELSEQREHLPEQFRLDETTQPPNPNLGEIELCRIHLELGDVRLEMPADPLTPLSGQPNLRHRSPAQARSHAYTHIGFLGPQSNLTHQHFTGLLSALPALYPSLQANLETIEDFAALARYDLIYLQPERLSALGKVGQSALSTYLASGGNLLLEAENEQQADAIRTALSQLWNFDLQPADFRHELQTQPFLFGSALQIREEGIKLYQSPGVLLLTPGLCSAWGIGSGLPRHTVRAAHELGINLLQFAWQRRQAYQLLQ
ncbi:MAG: hypothetical protein AAFP03_04045 [Cyanobacteria bacterium J06598_3]